MKNQTAPAQAAKSSVDILIGPVWTDKFHWQLEEAEKPVQKKKLLKKPKAKPSASTRRSSPSTTPLPKTVIGGSASDEMPDHLPDPSLIFPVRRPRVGRRIAYPPVLKMLPGQDKRVPFGTTIVIRRRRFNRKERTFGRARYNLFS